MSRPQSPLRAVIAVAMTLTFGASVLAVVGSAVTSPATACPPGFVATEREPGQIAPDQRQHLPAELQVSREIEWPGGCKPEGVESFDEYALRDAQRGAVSSAPFDTIPEGARLDAATSRQAMIDQGVTVPGSDGTAEVWGQGPLNFDEDPYDSGQGIVDSTGRIDDFFYDPTTDRLFAAIGTGGVWLSEDLGATWRSIGDRLPTNVTSAVTWTPSGGALGTVVVLTGEHTFGGASYTGLGAYWSDDLGETWNRGEGPPDGTLGFAIEVDPTNPDVIMAATGKGLWRSEDAGRTYTDVVLPVGRCEGDYNIETCNYAHFVTDVVFKEPGGVGADTDGGSVIAVVGYRAGMLEDVSGDFIHSEGNGVYSSDTGEPGTFTAQPGLADAAGGQERLGRIELGPAVGAEQDHDYLYAIVQDAVLFNGGAQFDPIGLPNPLGSNPTVFNGIYVSDDFGLSWTLLADDREMSDACLANRSVFCIPGLIEPGVQSWYNTWIAPDPTRQALGGVPTRVALGLEEVWLNRETQVPANQDPTTSFEVIGAYYGGADCLLVVTDCVASSNVGITTTHPDQHDGIWIPTVGEDGEPDGGVRLLVGHDGGISSQVVSGVEDPEQDSWQLEQENGLDTLLPYSVAAANDGTAQAGLQDNGTMRIVRTDDPETDRRQFEILGADGTIAAIDPEDALYSWAGSQGMGQLEVSSDGFLTSTSAVPPGDGYLFIPPLQMDPLNTDHVVTGGFAIEENLNGREATTGNWSVLFDLGSSEREPVIATDADGNAPEAPQRQTSAVETRGDAIYAAYCGPCDILNKFYPFDSGLVTNVAGDELPEPGTDKGFHFATAEGLPERYITSVAIDPQDATAQTIYVTLGGYTRKWVPPGTGADEAEALGTGHLYKSTDAGETFTDISGTLPDTPALWVEPRGDQLIVGTDLGPFLSTDTDGGPFAPLGGDAFPSVPVTGIQLQADDPDIAYLSVYGRGVMRYTFPDFTEGEVRRVAGAGREETSVEISRDVFESAETVVIARADLYADALSGASLAHARQAPMLLTRSNRLADVIGAEVTRVGATSAILLGGEAALAPQVEEDLKALGITDITRLQGADRFQTAAAIAGQLDGADTAWVVEGADADPTRGWPDAMSIAPVAARAGQAILLVETDRLPDATIQALQSGGYETARVVGGPSAVSAAVEAQVAAIEGGPEVGERVAGDNRFATSVAAAAVGLDNGQGLAQTWLARADDFADALAAGPSVAASGGSLLLVDRQGVDRSDAVAALLDREACRSRLIRLVGGEAALSAQVFADAEALLADCDGSIPTPPEQALVTGPGSGQTGPGGSETVAGPYGFEADAEGWTVESGNPSTTWSRDTSSGANGSSASFAVLDYQDNADTSLVSPALDGSGEQTFLSWFETVDTEGGGFDEMAVEWTADGGDTWTQLAVRGGQSAGFPEFSRQEVSFTPPADAQFQVRFRFFSDEICSSQAIPGLCPEGWEGVRVDDVEVRV